MAQPIPVSPAPPTFISDRGVGRTTEFQSRFTEVLPLSPEMTIIESSLKDLGQFVRDAIAKEVYAGESLTNCLTLKQSIETYKEHLERNCQIQRDWHQLLTRTIAIKANKSGDDAYQTLDAKLRETIESWRSEILNSDGLKQPIEDNIVTAKLAAQPIDDVKNLLATHIEAAIQNSTFAILSQLTKLVELEVLSLIQWFGDDTCTFRRFIRGLTVENGLQTDRFLRAERLDNRFVKQTFESIQKGETSRKLSCHIQHLVNAKTYPIGESKVLIPRDQKAFIASLPTWLSPAIRIVEGTLIRETLVEQDVGVYEWELKVGEWELTKDVLQWHQDPAIVLGPFVLSAWGPKEIQAELAMQESEAISLSAGAENDKRKLAPIRIIGLVEAMLALFFCMGWQASIANLFIGLLAALFAFVTLGNRWDSDLTEKSGSNPAPENAFGYAGMFVGFVVLSSLLLAVGLMVGGIGCALISLLVLQLYLNATFCWNPVSEADAKND